MEYRQLGGSCLKFPARSASAAGTFGGGTEFSSPGGGRRRGGPPASSTSASRRAQPLRHAGCLLPRPLRRDLGKAIAGKRISVLISTSDIPDG